MGFFSEEKGLLEMDQNGTGTPQLILSNPFSLRKSDGQITCKRGYRGYGRNQMISNVSYVRNINFFLGNSGYQRGYRGY